MITKERLKHLIKTWGTIYTTQALTIEKIDLVSEKDVNCKTSSGFKIDCEGNLCRLDSESNHYYLWRKEYLFETREEAEWTQKMYASRTIHFRPLMWKDIQDTVERIRTTNEEYLFIPVETFDNGTNIYSLYLCKAEDECSIDITDTEDSEEICKCFDFSEEGYVQAVEWARELFLGECDD